MQPEKGTVIVGCCLPAGLNMLSDGSQVLCSLLPDSLLDGFFSTDCANSLWITNRYGWGLRKINLLLPKFIICIAVALVSAARCVKRNHFSKVVAFHLCYVFVKVNIHGLKVVV